jgi:tetratricopeptide (TPR) repeat protein
MGGKQTWTGKYFHFSLAGVMVLSLFSCALLQDMRDREEAKATLLRGQKCLAQGDFDGSLNETQKALALSPSQPPADDALYTLGLVYAHFGNVKKDYGRSLGFFEQLMREFPRSPFAQEAKIWANVLQENKDHTQIIENLKMATEKLKETIDQLEKAERSRPMEVRAEERKVEERKGVRESLLRGQRSLAQGDFQASLNEMEKVLSLSPSTPLEDEALYTMGLMYAHFGNPKKDYHRSLELFRRLLKDHPKSPWAEQTKIWIAIIEENEKLNQVIEKSKQVDLEIEQKKREKVK